MEVVPLRRGDLRLTYRIPPGMAGIVVGSLVTVPLRRHREQALVLSVSGACQWDENKVKNVSALHSQEAVLTPELLEVAQWMSEYYMAPFSTVIETMLPAPIRKGMGPKAEYLAEIVRSPREEDFQRLSSRAKRQAELLRFLMQQDGAVQRNLLLRRTGMSSSVLEGLVEKGWVRLSRRMVERESYEDEFSTQNVESAVEVSMTKEQAESVRHLDGARRTGKYGCWLLHGVTGSGKTEVYLRLMESVLKEGGQVLFLVPEIALAPQTVARVRGRLMAIGARVVVWHSNLSAGQRADAFRSVAKGEANVVVGARSAVFAPFGDLRLVIVDEEHEPAFKQEETPRYNGRDVAILRAHKNEILCVLGSATPSLESLYNVRKGKYKITRLTSRVDDRQLPLLHVVDRRRAVQRGKKDAGLGLFSPLLREKMADRLEKGEQIILFLNRRGYSTTAICQDCGHVENCPHCSVSLTYHRTDYKIRCHLCGYEKPAPRECPSCRSPNFFWKGTGTQKVEDAVNRLFPKSRVVRLDADAMRRRNYFRAVFRDFRLGKIDILVGTQMIAKGLDFPNVTLVGLIDADLSLHQEDFRAAERTFQLIVQVSGRSGRGDRAGEVVVQTLTPHASPIQYARRRDFDGFLDEELSLREEYRYPPFRHLIRQVFFGKNEDKVWFVAEEWTKAVEKIIGSSIEIRGPAPAPLERVADEYRVQVWYFSPSVLATVRKLRKVSNDFVFPAGVRMTIDVDAMALR